MRLLYEMKTNVEILFSFFPLGNDKQVVDGSEFGCCVLVSVIASVFLFLVRSWSSVFYGWEQVCIDAGDSVTAFYKIISFLLYAPIRRSTRGAPMLPLRRAPSRRQAVLRLPQGARAIRFPRCCSIMIASRSSIAIPRAVT